jgi:hypothetical protein
MSRPLRGAGCVGESWEAFEIHPSVLLLRSLSQDTIEEEEVEGWMWEASSSKPEVESDAGAQKSM